MKVGKPNILFIIADDHRYDAINCFGNSEVQTPTLDSLAEAGVSFSKTYTMSGLTGAVCVPSRAALHTGVNPFRASVSKQVEDYQNIMTLNPNLKTLPQVLRQNGYHAHAIGKWHNDKQSFAKGFDSGDKLMFQGMSNHRKVPVHDFDPSGEYLAEAYYENQFSTELFCDQAVNFIENYQNDKPFFLYLALTAPHDPRTAPAKYRDMYYQNQLSLPENFMEQHPFDNGELCIRDEQLAPFPRTPEVVREHLADYYAMITHMDEQIERVLQTLEESGKDQETIIIYTADHGLAVGQHGLMGKQNMYEHSLHIPFIIKGKGIPKEKKVDALTCQYDIFPTLCDLVGLPIPETVEGQSQVPLLIGTSGNHRDSVYAVYGDVQRMVRDERWKLIKYYQSSKKDTGSDRIQLFDLEEDPWEKNDLSDDPLQHERIKQLLRKLTNWQERVGDPLMVPVTTRNMSNDKNNLGC